MFDCVIVGAGPAGGAAAYHLAKAGRQVLILEKASLPRYKPCGGGVSPIVGEWFDFDFSPAISARVSRIRYTWNKAEPVEIELDNLDSIWMVRRDVFDHFLVQQAQRQGAELRDQTEVTGLEWKSDRWEISSSQGKVEAKYVIAADGAKGSMAKFLGFTQRKPFFSAALEAEAITPVEDSNIAHLEFGMVKNGYIWNFPKADGYSIGIGTFHGSKPQNLKKIVSDYSPLFGVDFATIPQYGHPLCVWDSDLVLHTEHAVLAGEAACVVDPLSAEGIRPSIFSGIKAAEAIHVALAGDSEALHHYSEVMATEWGAEMKWAKRLAQVFYGFPKLAFNKRIRNSSGPEKIMNIFCGQMRYSDVAESAIQKIKSGMLLGLS